MADTALGVRPARMTYVVMTPIDSARGVATIRLLVASDGRVLRDSTKILSTTNRTFASYARKQGERSLFEPATRDGCAVAFWYEYTIGN
jgi:hypothetical protein